MAKMLGLQPKAPQRDPALVERAQAKAALAAKSAQADVLAQQDRIDSMFGARSLLGMKTSGSSSGGGGPMASLGTNWLKGLG